MLAWDHVHACALIERSRVRSDQESCIVGGQMDTGHKEDVQW
jgi:hypothetical protein